MSTLTRTLLLAAAIFCPVAAIRAGDLGSPRERTFKAANDGSEQAYMELLPEGFQGDEQHDLIFGLHGHGSTRKQFAEDPRPECVAFREFAGRHAMIAVTPDYRGTTSWMGPKAEGDMVQLIGELRRAYRVRRVFLAGGSMGGSAALTFAALHPDLVDGVTALNPLANHAEYDRFQDFIAKSFGGDKQQVSLEYRKRSAELSADRLTMPVAITVGGKDDVVPPDSARRLAAALEKLGRPVLLIDRPDGGHATSRQDALAALDFMLTASGSR